LIGFNEVITLELVRHSQRRLSPFAGGKRGRWATQLTEDELF
jgi:hypothetical protein